MTDNEKNKPLPHFATDEEAQKFTIGMFNPPHVGAHIQEELESLNLSTAHAAKALGVSRQQLHRVLAGTSGVSAEMAVRLEAVIGSTADHWMRLQGAYDLAQAHQHQTEITKGLTRVQLLSQLQSDQEYTESSEEATYIRAKLEAAEKSGTSERTPEEIRHAVQERVKRADDLI